MRRSNLTRKDIARAINEKMGFSKSGAERLVSTFFSAMKEKLVKGESIKLVHFGTLGIRRKAPRRGRNPQTGESMMIIKRKMVTFKPSKGLRDKINK